MSQRVFCRRLIVFLAFIVIALPAAGQGMTTYVEASDGTLLATDVYLPLFSQEPWPAVLIRTPYDKDTLWEAGLALSLLDYAVVIQDTRGRFASEGEDSVFRNDADDGRVTVGWVAEQSWCNGRIGGFGGSAFAITEYLMAPDAGPALTSIFAVVATPDLYHHAFVQGGAVRESLAYNWLADQGSLDIYEEILDHRLKTEWWDPVEVLDHTDRVTTSGFHAGGWYDIFGQGTLTAFAEFQNRGGPGARGRQYLLMGPWTHGSLGSRDVGEIRYPANASVDPIDLIQSWLDHTLRGDNNEVADWPPALVYMMGAVGEPGAPGNVWVELDAWPPPSTTRSLYLTADSELAAEPAVGALELTSDPSDPVPTLGGANLFPSLEVDGRAMGDGPYDQRSIEVRDDVLTFTSEALDEPLAVMGRVSCSLWVRPDTTDFDLTVRLTDVYPDGASMLVLDGIQRARMRCGDDHECLAVPGEPIEIIVDLWSTAIVFNAGHRIRISVSGTNAPRFEINPNNGGAFDGDDPPVVAHPELLFGPDHPSRLVLPVVSTQRRATGRVGSSTNPFRIWGTADDRIGSGILRNWEWSPAAWRHQHLPQITVLR